MNATERLEALEDALHRLRMAAVGAAIIVEGRNDVAALESLGVGGTHLVINTGHSLEARMDAIAEEALEAAWPRVILLTDWDRTGGRLAGRLQRGLAARVPLDIDLRKRLARASHAPAVEEVPGDLAALRASVQGSGFRP